MLVFVRSCHVRERVSALKWRNVQITGGNVVAGNERLLLVHDLVDTDVGVEIGLDILENDNGAVSSSTSVIN